MSRILILLLISSLLAIVESGRRRRWKVNVGAKWSRGRGWSVSAGVSVSFGKKRSTLSLEHFTDTISTLNAKQDVQTEAATIERCLPTLPCKFEIYDTNENGAISYDEFENKLTDIGFNDYRHSIFIALDADGDAIINQEEFNTGTVEIANAILFPECNHGN